MKKFIYTAGTAIMMAIGCFEPIEPQGEVEPYMAVHRSVEVEKPIEKPVLWGTDKLNKEDKELEYSEEDILLLERVTMSEASIEPYDCKVATCVTVLKRAKKGGKSIPEVVYAPYQYSVADNGYPTAEVKAAVQDAIRMEGEYPDGMIYFRADRFHDFGTPYMVYGNHYFSLEE